MTRLENCTVMHGLISEMFEYFYYVIFTHDPRDSHMLFKEYLPIILISSIYQY